MERMTHDEVIEVKEGQKWLEEIIFKSRSVHVSPKNNYLERRIKQLYCLSLYYKTPNPTKFKAIIKYILGACYIINLILKSTFLKNKRSGPFSIWDSDIDPHVSSTTFNDFIKSKQVIDLKDEHFLFVKSLQNTQLFEYSSFSPNPIFQALQIIHISFKDVMCVSLNFIGNFFSFIQIAIKYPDATYIYKDFLTEPVIKLLLNAGLKKFYRTNSNFDNQEFWCERIDFNTVWYSINSRSIQFRNPEIGNLPDNPHYYFIHLGTSWTWNQMHSSWLQKISKHQVNIVGPIMFYSSTTKQKKGTANKRIIIFDVTPCEDSYIRKHVSQKGFNYYNEKYCLQFISDIVETCKHQDWSVVLKPKRKFNPMHSSKYLSFLKKCELQNPNFKVISPDSNLFNEIIDSDIVISIPFSSPFDIANSLGIPAIYYDPTGDVDFEIMGYTKDHCFNNLLSLQNGVRHLLSSL